MAVNSEHALEAYNAGTGWGRQYSDLSQVPGYAEWSAANPSLVSYAEQGFSSGRSSATILDSLDSLVNQSQPRGSVTWYVDGVPYTDYNAYNEARLRSPDLNWEAFSDAATQRALAQGSTDPYEISASQGKVAVYDSASGQWVLRDSEEARREYLSGTPSFSRVIGPEGDVQGQWDRDLKNQSYWNEAYGEYIGTGRAAEQWVDDQIARESSRAALLGIDYNTNEEARQRRINERFSSQWSAEDMDRLQSLSQYSNEPFEMPYEFVEGATSGTGEDTTSLVSTTGPTVASAQTTTLLDTNEDQELLGA